MKSSDAEKNPQHLCKATDGTVATYRANVVWKNGKQMPISWTKENMLAIMGPSGSTGSPESDVVIVTENGDVSDSVVTEIQGDLDHPMPQANEPEANEPEATKSQSETDSEAEEDGEHLESIPNISITEPQPDSEGQMILEDDSQIDRIISQMDPVNLV